MNKWKLTECSGEAFVSAVRSAALFSISIVEVMIFLGQISAATLTIYFFFFPFKKEEQFLAWFLQHGLLDFFFQLEVWFFFLRIHFILSNEGGPYQKINFTKVVQISEQMDSKVNHLFCISIY